MKDGHALPLSKPLFSKRPGLSNLSTLFSKPPRLYGAILDASKCPWSWGHSQGFRFYRAFTSVGTCTLSAHTPWV